MANRTYPAGPLFAAPATNGSPQAKYGTHIDTLGVGGLRTVETLADRDAIPFKSVVEYDGLSSGMRKVGMKVHVVATGKTYKLFIPGFLLMDDDTRITALQNNAYWTEDIGTDGVSQTDFDNAIDTLHTEIDALSSIGVQNSLTPGSTVLAPSVDAVNGAVTTLQTQLSTKADLVNGVVSSSQLPSYVDDVLEFANLAAMPIPGESGKIYVALDSANTYRWGGSAYTEISKSLLTAAELNSVYSLIKPFIVGAQWYDTIAPASTVMNATGRPLRINTDSVALPAGTVFAAYSDVTSAYGTQLEIPQGANMVIGNVGGGSTAQKFVNISVSAFEDEDTGNVEPFVFAIPVLENVYLSNPSLTNGRSYHMYGTSIMYNPVKAAGVNSNVYVYIHDERSIVYDQGPGVIVVKNYVTTTDLANMVVDNVTSTSTTKAPSVGAVKTALASLDTNVVHKSGDEIITGTKTFTESIFVGNGSNGSGLKLKKSDGTNGYLRVFEATNLGSNNSINFGAVGEGGALRAHGAGFFWFDPTGQTTYASLSTAGVFAISGGIQFPDGTVQTTAGGSGSAVYTAGAGEKSIVPKDPGGGTFNLNNTMNGRASVIGGGRQNIVDYNASEAGIGSGYANQVSGGNAYIGGGTEHIINAAGFAGFIGGGTGCYVSNQYSSVVGGNANEVQGSFSGTLGGNGNALSGSFSGIGGGFYNNNSGDYSFIGSGHGHYVSAGSSYSFIGGGHYNTARGQYASIAGGDGNSTNSTGSAIGGGRSNASGSGDFAVIIGGLENNVNGQYAVVLGGTLNVANGYATIVSGYSNTVVGENSTIHGGNNNTITADSSDILGGNYNTIEGYANRIYGGQSNTIGPGAAYVTMINCIGLTVDDEYNATYINNELFVANPPAPDSVDVYDITTTTRTLVSGGTFASGELTGTQPADSKAGQKFVDAAYMYEFMRGLNGTLVWVRTSKS